MKSHLLCFLLLCFSSLSVAQSLDEQIKAKQTQIADLQLTLNPQVAPLLVTSNLRIWTSGNILALVGNQYNSQANKTVHYHETLQEGQLINSNGGGLGCGYYAELHDASGDITVPVVSATYQPDGSVLLQTSFQANVRGQVAAHMKGPAGPCSILHPWPTCDCPIGGGFGTSALATAIKGASISAIAKLSGDSASWLHYDLGQLSPPSMEVTISFSLEHVGDVGVVAPINLPQSSLAHGDAPNVFQGQGEIKIGAPVNFSKQFAVSVIPTAVVSDAQGYSVKASADISWHNK